MSEPLLRALSRLRALILDEAVLIRAVGSGRRRGETPRWRRVEIRYVDLKAGRYLQVTAYDQTKAHTSNHAGPEATRALDDLLDEPFGNWHVWTTTEEHQLRVTKRGEAMVHVSPAVSRLPSGAHDRAKPRMLAEDAPVLRVLGISDSHGRVKPSRQSKYRQVDEFLRSIDAVVVDAIDSGRLPQPTAERPLGIVDLGCGNAYLTFAAHAFLTGTRDLPVRLLGVDRQGELVERNNERAAELGAGESLRFRQGTIDDVDVAALGGPPDVVLALHACDTATDDALARAVRWRAPLVLAAPCCHHDVASQLRRAPTPAPYALLTRHGILRERFADTLTDAMRASVLRLSGYQVEVIDFVDSKHTPRNTLLRAVRTGAAAPDSARQDLADLTTTWGVRPRLADLLGDGAR
ncbi:MAG TPA: SAM-dependent methyltransferase [Nocardioidaceae bacterium]|nr:SAM-dependent methyltransferase [Nocardioidaceae bacterium]